MKQELSSVSHNKDRTPLLKIKIAWEQGAGNAIWTEQAGSNRKMEKIALLIWRTIETIEYWLGELVYPYIIRSLYFATRKQLYDSHVIKERSAR
jgi:hypothetical protein